MATFCNKLNYNYAIILHCYNNMKGHLHSLVNTLPVTTAEVTRKMQVMQSASTPLYVFYQDLFHSNECP